VLIGGRGSILGPLIATILLTALPEIAAPLVAWSTFLYAALLLVIALVAPGGIAELLDFKSRKPLESNRAIAPRPVLLPDVERSGGAISLSAVTLAFGGVRAMDGLSVELRPGEVHGLIGPNGSGKTTTLNVISGYYRPEAGTVLLDGKALPASAPQTRAALGIAPHLPDAAPHRRRLGAGETSWSAAPSPGAAASPKSLLALPRHRRDEAALREDALRALAVVGLESLAAIRADRLQHSELRFVEIARALMLRPRFLLLDEPAAGLAASEISALGGLVSAIAARGTGVLLVEHHADLIFDICDRVTVLNLGRVLASGTPAEIRAHREVVSAYLGA